MNLDELIRPELLGMALAEATVDLRWITFDAALIPGGKSNLTFRLTSSAGSLILRRPPTGALLPSAHDMAREVEVQKALHPTGIPVPQIVLNEPTGFLIGTPFYVMTEVEGHVIRGSLPSEYADSPSDKRALARAMAQTLAALHAIDPNSVSLGNFGRPEGFVARQLRRWRKQWEHVKTTEVPALDELGSRLTGRVPVPSRISIVHGDYRIDNCVFSLTDPGTIEAVLDWELSSLGDPLVDLGLARFYWRAPGDPTVALVPSVTSDPTFPTRDFLTEQYARSTGLNLDDLPFYDAFSRYKFAIITQGVQVRAANGDMAGQSFGDLDDEVRAIAIEGIDMLREV